MSIEKIGQGVTHPYKVLLEFEGRTVAGIWKPLGQRHFEQVESWRAEIATYRLSELLELRMVPPTVERRIGKRVGSLQYWVEGYRQFGKAVQSAMPPTLAWSAQAVRMNFFDTLIDNPDRNTGNFLVDENWSVVLIDHSRALSFETNNPRRAGGPPRQYDSSLVERARALDAEELEAHLADVMSRGEMRSLLRSRDRLIAAADAASQRAPVVSVAALHIP